MATTVTSWLAGNRDYATGLQLLKDHGASEFLIGILSDGADHYNTLKLIDEIKILAGEELKRNTIATTEPPADQYLEDSQDASYQLMEALNIQPALVGELAQPYTPDDNLEKKLRIDRAIKVLFKEMTHLHGKQTSLPDGPELFQVSRELRLKDLKRQDLWDQLHYFNTHGKWFDEEPENMPKPENLEQHIKNLMGNRSKAKAELKRPLPEGQKVHYENKIKALTEQIEKHQAMRNA